MSFSLGRLVLIVAMVATPVAAFAQGAGAPPTDLHQYPLPTYEEDWRALQGAARTDLWDAVKFRAAVRRRHNLTIARRRGAVHV